MGYSHFLNKSKVPKMTTRKSEPITTNFAKGIYTYKPNDTMSQDEIRLAENARFDRVGEYKTRKGFKPIIPDAIGSAIYSTNTGGGADDFYPTSEVTPVTFTAASNATIYSMTVNVQWASNATDHTTVPRVKLTIGDNSYYACVDPSTITTAPAAKRLYFMEAPSVTAGQTITISVGVQNGVPDNIIWATEHAKTDILYVLRSCTPGGIKSMFETRIGGNKGILFLHNNDLYMYGFTSGLIIPIRTLPNGVNRVRFSQNLEQIRYADGKEGPRVVKYENAWVDNAITTTDLKTGTNLNISVNNIMNGTADNLVYGAVDPYTEAVWTYPYGYTYAKAPAFTTTATISGSVGTTLSVNVSTISPSGIAVGDWITGQGTGTATVTSISGSQP